MPIYMDRHDLSGVTAKDVAQAHQKDLSIQEDFGCRGITYWFDEKRGAAFCLIEAPDKDAVKNMHDHAHGLVPHQILEVENNVVEAFLGRIQDPEPDNNIDESGLLILNDPAFRVIMAIEIEESELIKYHKKHTETEAIKQSFNKIIQKIITQFNGRRVEHVKDGFLISFSSVSKAVCCAMEIQSKLQTIVTQPEMKIFTQIGLSAGVPVTKNKTFFGETIQQANRLCKTAQGGQIFISHSLTDYLSENDLMQINEQKSVKIFNVEEEEFLKQLYMVMNTFSNDPNFTVKLLNTKIGLSKSQMYRKTISTVGLSPNDFIKEYRLRMSLKRLKDSQDNISDIAYDSGFSSPSYFSKCFQKRYELLPSDYQFIKKEQSFNNQN